MSYQPWGSITTVTSNALVENVAVAGFGQSQFVVVWQESTDVRATVFNAFGQPGAPFTVNTTTAGSQSVPQVAKLADGGFVVVWEDSSATGGDTSGLAVRGQRFTAAGARTGSEFLVNTTVTNDQMDPVVAASGTGFVVVWNDKSNASGNGDDIRAQRFDANGAKLGAEMLVDGSAGRQQEATVTDRAGGFVIAWTSDNDTSGSVDQVKLQAFAENAGLVGAEFVLNAGGAGLNGTLDLGRIDAAGNFGLLYGTNEPIYRLQSFSNAGAANTDYQVVADTTVGTFVQGVQLAAWNTVTGETEAVGWAIRQGVNGNIQLANVGLAGISEQSTLHPTTDANAPRVLDAAMLQDGRIVVVSQDGVNGIKLTIADGRSGNFGVVTAAGASTLIGADTGSPDANNVITGSAQVETMYGLGGNDYLYGYGGNDLLIAGEGIDVLLADAGNDTLYGQGGQDYLFGGTGSNVFIGGDGVDVFNSEAGSVNDTMFGGEGGDYFYSYGVTTTYSYGEAGNDIFVIANGAPGVAFGGDGQDYFYMGAGSDYMEGNAGVDVLIGGNGNDTFVGGAGTDYLFLGQGVGADLVMHDAQSGVDVVQNFQAGFDTIRLQGTTLTSFAQVQAATSDYDSFIVITIDANTAIWLVGVRPADLTAANFVFA